jgi:hypothetical protein
VVVVVVVVAAVVVAIAVPSEDQCTVSCATKVFPLKVFESNFIK